MQIPRIVSRRLLLGGVVGALAIGGASAGYAASGTHRQSPQQTVITDAARQLKVTPRALSGALEAAYRHELRTLVAGKKLTQKQADRLGRRVEGGNVPLAPLRGRGEARKGTMRAAVASYLGIDARTLRTELRSGRSLAQIAVAHGRSVAGLKAAMTAAVRTRLDTRVAAGALTAERAAARLTKVEARLDRMIARSHHVQGATSP